MADPGAVDAYLASLPDAQRRILERVRSVIARAVPDAVETISYGMPAFRLRDQFLVSYAGWKRHCSLYPLTDSFLAAHATELDGYDRTKGSVHFTPDRPLPDEVVEQLVLGRVADLGLGDR